MPRPKRESTRKLFQEWLAIPKGMRADRTGISTQQEFASKYNISARSLTQWKKEKGFMDGVDELRRERLDEELTEVYQSLIGEAKSGNMDAIRFAFKLSGRYNEKTEVEHTHTSDRERQAMSDEELAGLFADALSTELGADKDDVKGAVLDAMQPDDTPKEIAPEEDGETQEDEESEEETSEIDELLMDDEFEPDYE